ncbi:hypothetical protein FJD35_12490 [Pseudomonas mandelii]|nr:hypothetical protein FJD35_12490 [Pseudomonas mandelii]
MWRASLLALGCVAAPNQPLRFLRKIGGVFATAAQSSASKLPHHKSHFPLPATVAFSATVLS